jgi:hypothetical protein
VAEDRWGDFIEWARRSLAKPSFDREDRDYRLRVAAALHDLIEAARDGRPLAEPALAVAQRVADSLDLVVPLPEASGLVRWAEEDEAGLAAALRPFADPSEDPEARLERFLEVVESRPDTDGLASGGLVAGSLLNFGASPGNLAPIRPARYARLRELLGEDAEIGEGVEQYRRDLAFLDRVDSVLRASGVPVRDMIDVESLAQLCFLERELWAGAGPHSGVERASEPELYLSACMMYRNEARYLAEWIEFHLLMGVERFYLYDNGSDDEHREVLEPYVREGIAVVYDWPGRARTAPEVNALQIGSYDHCISTHRDETRWIAMMDADLFLFSPTGRSLPDVLGDYERWPGVVVNTVPFGTSGHVAHPEGLVIENYTIRLDLRMTRFVKSIVDPAAVTRCLSAHKCEFSQGTAVDENGYPFSPRWNMTKSASFERLRINHYFARSEEGLRTKEVRRGADPASEELRKTHAEGVRDETIVGHAPAVREALQRRAAQRAPS